MRTKCFILLSFSTVILISFLGCTSFGGGGQISGVNWALADNGGRVSAFSEEQEHPASTLNNGVTSSEGWDQGEGWQASISMAMSGRQSGDARREEHERNWVIVDFAHPVTLNLIKIYTIDSQNYPAKDFGISDLLVQYELETASKEKIWANVKKYGKGIGSQDSVIRDNKSGIVEVRFEPVNTQRIRVLIYATNDLARIEDGGRSKEGIIRLIEVEAYGTGKYTEQDQLEQMFKPG